jgi:beta-phosphoglucomutase
MAVIFDLDGVLVDTAKYHYLAWKRLARELGGDLSEAQNEALKGVSRMDSLDIILRLNNLTLTTEERERMASRKNEWFVEFIAQMSPDELFDGAIALLETLRANGIKRALASSSKNARQVMGLLGIADLFDAVVDGTMIEHSKPHPEIFLKAASLLNVAPAACLVVEDAEAGVEAAVRAGMPCIGLGSPESLRKANKVISELRELTLRDIAELTHEPHHERFSAP